MQLLMFFTIFRLYQFGIYNLFAESILTKNIFFRGYNYILQYYLYAWPFGIIGWVFDAQILRYLANAICGVDVVLDPLTFTGIDVSQIFDFINAASDLRIPNTGSIQFYGYLMVFAHVLIFILSMKRCHKLNEEYLDW